MTKAFIKTNHPSANVAPRPEVIEKILKRKWVGQAKANGHRLQVHIHPNGKIISFTRQGTLHTAPLTANIATDLQKFAQNELIVFEAEWIKGLQRIFLFDLLHIKGKTLAMMPFCDRYALLQENFKAGDSTTLLPLLPTTEECMKVLMEKDESIEGLVFKSLTDKGWNDSGIVRCLKKDLR